MRIMLIHNPTAGHGRHDKGQLISALSRARHNVVYQSIKKDNYKKALKKPTDLVLVAGGDGTVGKIAARLIDSGIPLSVLPLGTANNLARTLGFTIPVDKIIQRLGKGHRHAFDIGIARGPWGKRYVFEGVGAGLLADYVQAANKSKKKKSARQHSPEQELARHLVLLRQMLHDYPTQKWNIRLDGKDISGQYILWEAMNIRSVGPALYLAPWAETKDGEFDFVCVREQDRDLLLEHLDARIAGKKSSFPFPMSRFRELKVVVKKSVLHLDDKLWPKKKDRKPPSTKIKVTVKPSALLIWQPNRGN